MMVSNFTWSKWFKICDMPKNFICHKSQNDTIKNARNDVVCTKDVVYAKNAKMILSIPEWCYLC